MPLDLVAIAYAGLAALAFSTRRHALPEPWSAPPWRARWRREAIMLLVLAWARTSGRYGFATGTVALLGVGSVAGILLVLALSRSARAALVMCAILTAAGFAAPLAPIQIETSQ